MKPITAIVLGAGQRGANVYAALSLIHIYEPTRP